MEKVKNMMGNMIYTLNEKHKKNIVCSIVLEDIQKKGIDL